MLRRKAKSNSEKARRMAESSKINHGCQGCNCDLCCKEAAVITMDREGGERDY